MSTRREYVGSLYTDVARVILADPCKVLADENGRGGLPYGRFLDAIDFFRGDPKAPSTLAACAGLSIATVENCDGWLNVYVERDSNGWARRLIVDLNARVKPGDTSSGATQ